MKSVEQSTVSDYCLVIGLHYYFTSPHQLMSGVLATTNGELGGRTGWRRGCVGGGALELHFLFYFEVLLIPSINFWHFFFVFFLFVVAEPGEAPVPLRNMPTQLATLHSLVHRLQLAPNSYQC